MEKFYEMPPIPNDPENEPLAPICNRRVESDVNQPADCKSAGAAEELAGAAGQDKCPKCGATDVSLNVSNGLLRCNYCRHQFEPQKEVGMETDIGKLEGVVIGSGAKDIIPGTDEILTFRCGSCGAEVVIDTAHALQARCHWCRNTLSVNQQIPNGAVPDVVLPFGITKEVAKAEMDKFVSKRKFFAHPKFKKEFTADNVMGVYLPYMVIDVNAHALLTGQGEHKVRSYELGSGGDTETFYDADLYDVEREFDIHIEGLTVESSADKLDNTERNKTNNILHSIMPFDIENCVRWNANYLKGYTSEKRDVNVEQLKDIVVTQAEDIARHKANDTLEFYGRGVAWENEEMKMKGEQWKAAYLPVWLYSYRQKEKDLTHYVAVNARTKETMGSVPLHQPKLLFVSAIIEVLSFIYFLMESPFTGRDDEYHWSFLLAGFLFWVMMYARYRNRDARHYHEKETKATISNVRRKDVFVKSLTKLQSAIMKGANNTSVKGRRF